MIEKFYAYRVFNKNLENQRLALNAARKAFDLTSNQAGGGYPGYSGGYSSGYFGGYYPNPTIASRFPAFPSIPSFAMPRPITNFGNSAFASAAAGPGYQHHVASIYPSNPVSSSRFFLLCIYENILLAIVGIGR